MIEEVKNLVETDETVRERSVSAWTPGELAPVEPGLVLAGTGHRPQRLGAPWPASRAELERLAEDALRTLRPSRVVSGMALGWDLALAAAASRLDVPVTAAVPFGHELPASECEPSALYSVRSRCSAFVGETVGGSVTVFETLSGKLEVPATETVVEVGPPPSWTRRQWQGSRWSLDERVSYLGTLAGCDEVVVVSSGGYAPQKMFERNRWMVARCDAVLALWSGSAGGTSACVADAVRAGRSVVNLWEAWRARLT